MKNYADINRYPGVTEKIGKDYFYIVTLLRTFNPKDLKYYLSPVSTSYRFTFDGIRNIQISKARMYFHKLVHNTYKNIEVDTSVTLPLEDDISLFQLDNNQEKE